MNFGHDIKFLYVFGGLIVSYSLCKAGQIKKQCLTFPVSPYAFWSIFKEYHLTIWVLPTVDNIFLSYFSDYSDDTCMHKRSHKEVTRTIEMFMNPLVCNSSLCWLLMPHASAKIILDLFPCTEPPRLRWILWRDITPTMLNCGEFIWNIYIYINIYIYVCVCVCVCVGVRLFLICDLAKYMLEQPYSLYDLTTLFGDWYRVSIKHLARAW